MKSGISIPLILLETNMNKALNRIEYEYIFDTFLREKPPLTLLCNNKFIEVEPFFYKVIGEFVFFKADGVKTKDELKVFFNHRSRPLYFFSRAEKKEGALAFKISDKFYKYDDNFARNKPHILLWNSKGFKLSADISENFPLSFPFPPIVEDEEAESFFLFRSKISSLMKLNPDKIPTAFFYRLYVSACKSCIPELEPCLLYIDSEFILIFCSEKKVEPISVQVSAQTEINFGHRKINLLSVYSFFLPISGSKSTDERYGVLCLLIKNIQEEDKRFLHEKAHSSRYGYPE